MRKRLELDNNRDIKQLIYLHARILKFPMHEQITMVAGVPNHCWVIRGYKDG